MRVGRGDIHRRVVAALIGKHGRNIFPLVRRRSRHCFGSSPRRGEPEQDRREPSERKGHEQERRHSPGSERHGLGATNLLAVEGIARGEASALPLRRAEMKTGRRRCLHPAANPLWVTA